MQIPKWLVIGLVVGVIIYVPVYILVTELFGIPLWWAFPALQLSPVGIRGTFEIHATPDSPSSLGQMVTVSVKNMTKQPVVNATVNIIYGGVTVFNPLTNQSGQVAFQYPGEPTILRVEKEGYGTGFAVIPHSPVPWVREQTTAYVVAFTSSAFGALLGSLGTFFITKRAHSHNNQGKPRPGASRK